MDILKVKVGDQWVGIPAIQGPQGPKGDTGDTGPSGQNGSDGFSPSISVTDITGGHRVTITDATGPHSFDVMDGDSADAPVQDVQVDGTSILNDGVANFRNATWNRLGVVKPNPDYGIGAYEDAIKKGILYLSTPTDTELKAGSSEYKAIKASNQHISAFYALAKLAGYDLKNETVTLGQYPNSAKAAIAQMLGIGQLYSPMEEIVRVSINEDLATITVNTDKYGLPFKLAHAQIIHKIGTPTTSTRDYIRADFYDQDNNVKSLPTLQIAVAGASTNWNVYTFHTFGGMAYSLGKACSTGNAQNVQQATYTATTTDGITNITSITALTGVRFHQYDSTKTLIPAGGEIIIYGCRVIE